MAGGLAWSVFSRDHVFVDGWYASSTGRRSFRQLWNPPTAKICAEASQLVSQAQQIADVASGALHAALHAAGSEIQHAG